MELCRHVWWGGVGEVTACSRYFLVLAFPNSFSKLGVKHEITEYLADVCQRQACGKVPYFLDSSRPRIDPALRARALLSKINPALE